MKSDILARSAGELGIELSDKGMGLFMDYLANLKDWNKKINLTAITEDEEIIVNHFVDSISIAPLLEDNRSLLDIGSGGGFPGIPLKIVRPSLDVTLLDSVNKKVSFLKDTIRKLDLENIEAVWGRAEDPENNIPRKHFDYVVTRAVGSILETLELCSPYVSKDGVIVLMRGKKGSEEWAKQSKELDNEYNLLNYREFTLPYSDSKRIIIIVKPKHLL